MSRSLATAARADVRGRKRLMVERFVHDERSSGTFVGLEESSTLVVQFVVSEDVGDRLERIEPANIVDVNTFAVKYMHEV